MQISSIYIIASLSLQYYSQISIQVVCSGLFRRMWDLEKDENYVLGLGMKSGEIADPSEMITCIAYSSDKGDVACA